MTCLSEIACSLHLMLHVTKTLYKSYFYGVELLVGEAVYL